MSGGTQARVTAQYERFPYPARDPDDERRRVIGTWLDNLDLLNHHCFRGEATFDAGFRVLVAGGGTGDGTIFLAHQLRGRGARIVHVDVSQAAIDIARRRAAVHGFDDIRFVHASLLDLPALGLGTFDYINCVGVLHHLDDPRAGLDALLAVLADGGAMAILVYAQYGRTGVYQLQSLLRLLERDGDDDDARVARARRVLAALPATNAFKRAEALHSDHTAGGDAGVYDLLLHPRDRAYTVPELYAWIEDECGLAIQFSDLHRGRLPYEPETYLTRASSELRARLAKKPARTRHAIAELAGGDLTRHSFYASRGRDTKARYGELDYVPLFPVETYQPSATDFVRIIGEHGGRPFRLTHAQSGLACDVDPARHVATIFSHIDGTRTFGEIFERVRSDPAHRAAPPSDAALFAEFAPWYDALESIERLQLRRAGPTR